MDRDTLANHISNLSQKLFNNVCDIILRDVFHLNAINVDGKGDGGTDCITFNKDATRSTVAYQITTQKSDIKKKAYRDAKKSIDKLGVNQFFYLTSVFLEEADTRTLEVEIRNELDIITTCLSSRNIAELLLKNGLLYKFLDESNYPLPRTFAKSDFDYKEAALPGYTMLSSDAKDLKTGIYDDSIMFVLSNEGKLNKPELVAKVLDFLSLPNHKKDLIVRRIDALFGKNKLEINKDGLILLNKSTENDINNRKRIYEKEMLTLLSAQIDLLSEYQIEWTSDDAKKVAIWIANAFIDKEISNLKDVKASIASNPIFEVGTNGVEKIKSYFIREKKVQRTQVNEIVQRLLYLASDHPLIVKITRASVYVALEGNNLISSAKALGANRWSDFDVLVEPTVAIPYICSLLYSGNTSKYFRASISCIDNAKNNGTGLFIPFVYINECAGHLLNARKYAELQIAEDALQYSKNAFVSNYFNLKQNGVRIPNNFMDYLASFSPAIKIERSNRRDWIRSIMTDLQSHLSRANIEFLDIPFYTEDDCKDFECDYVYYLHENNIEKKPHLIRHDVYVMKFTNDKIINENEHWIITTFDKSLIQTAQKGKYKGWITTPYTFIDMTEGSKPLSETQYVSLVYSVATYSCQLP